MLSFRTFGLVLLASFFLPYNLSFAQGNWVWKHGANNTNQASSFGSMGVPAPTNTPGARYECAEWTDLNGDLWLYGGGLGAVRNSGLWKFDSNTEEWTFMHGNTTNNAPPVYGTQGVSNPANTPGGIGFCANTWTDLSGNLWFYGGDNGGLPYSDLWKYNIATNEWTWVQGTAIPGTAPVYGTMGVAAATNSPGSRVETSCSWIDNSGNLWLFGGSFSGAGDTRNDLWKYDISTNQWTWMKGSSGPTAPGVYGTQGVSNPANTPGARWCYSHWTDSNGDFWLFGGIDASTMIGFGMYNDLWKYDVSSNEWTWMKGSDQQNPTANYGIQCLPSANNNPPARGESRACWADDCGNFWLFGGRNSSFDHFNDLWRYSPSNNEWTWVHGSSSMNQSGVYGTLNVPAPGNRPGARMGSVGWFNQSGLWLFGGTESGEFNDLWLYNDTVNSDFTFTPTGNCNIYDFTNQSTTGCDEISTYFWNFGDPASGAANIDSIQDPTHNYSGNGTYQVSLIVNNCAGGADTTIQTIQINCGLSVSLISDTICSGDCVNLLAATSGSLGFVNYVWDNGILLNDSIVNVCPIATTTYTVIATDSIGMSDTATATITVFPYPVVNLGNDTSFCSGTIILDAQNPGATYLWQDGSTNQTFLVGTTGQYYVEVDNGGCTTSDTINITINGPLVNLGPDLNACEPASFTLDAQNPGMTYLWQDGSTNQTLTITTSGTYWVTVTDGNNCITSDTLIATITPLPIVNLGNDTTLCSGTIILDAQNPGATYLWQDGSINQTLTVNTSGVYWVDVSINGCITSDSILINIDGPLADLGPDIQTCTPTLILDAGNIGATYLWQDGSSNQTFNVLTFGTYFVDVTVGGCTASDTITITQGAITVALPNDTILCSGSALVLDAQNPGATYNWSNGSTSQTITASTPGTYWVTVTEGVCTATDTIEITYSLPVADFSSADTIGCAPVIVNFTDLSTTPSGTITSWFWDFGDSQSSNQQNPSHNYDTSGVYNVTLTVTNSDGCQTSSTQQVQVIVYPNPIAAFTISPNPALSGEVVFFQDQSVNAQSWYWSFGDETYSSIQNPTHIYDDIGNFNVQLTVTNAYCVDSILINLIVEEELIYYVPNSFTPDGDEYNNTFSPVFTAGFDPYDYHLMIFNRWGELIFESFNVEIGWDGTYDGKLIQDGTYIWKIEFGDINNDKRHIVHGHVNLLR